MVTLTLIGEPFPDADAQAHLAAARDLTEAIALTAPRGCSARLLIARDTWVPSFDTALATVETLPMPASALLHVWRSGATARPLDGEFVHAMTPMVPLRSRHDDDGSQNSVLVPHALAWQSPEMMGASQARLYRSYVKRAVKRANTLLTTTHATAAVLQRHYGAALPVQVLPTAAPSDYLARSDADARRAALGLPEHYLVSSAPPGPAGRLEAIYAALAEQPSLPPLVVLAREESRDAVVSSVPAELTDRVIVIVPGELTDIGAMLSGAQLYVAPEMHIGAGYEILGALAAGVPVVHLGCEAVAEMALEAGREVAAPEGLGSELARLIADDDARAQLRVHALDRSRTFSWHGTAWQLWELHANL